MTKKKERRQSLWSIPRQRFSFRIRLMWRGRNPFKMKNAKWVLQRMKEQSSWIGYSAIYKWKVPPIRRINRTSPTVTMQISMKKEKASVTGKCETPKTPQRNEFFGLPSRFPLWNGTTEQDRLPRWTCNAPSWPSLPSCTTSRPCFSPRILRCWEKKSISSFGGLSIVRQPVNHAYTCLKEQR